MKKTRFAALRFFVVLAGLSWIGEIPSFAGDLPNAAKPNIVFLLVDDLGWKDVGYNDSPLCETPHIDQFAAEGMRFTRAYAPAPICSASRAGILTGRTPARLHLEFVTKNYGTLVRDDPDLPLVPPPFTYDLPLSETTIPELLKEAGYETAFFGKWHLNAHYQRYLGWSPTHGPTAQGFDVAEEDFGGHPYNADAQHPTDSFQEGEYPPDSMTDRAIRYLEKRAADTTSSKPFYLQVNHFYVHAPVKNQADWLTEKYAERLGENSPDAAARYAAYVEIVDYHAGRLFNALDRLNLRDNTYVVLFSDNGGDPNYTRHAPLRGHKWTLYEGGIRIPMIVRAPGVVEPGSVCDTPVVGTDLLPTFIDWAGVEPPPELVLDGRSLVNVLRGERDPDLENRILIFGTSPIIIRKRERRTPGSSRASMIRIRPSWNRNRRSFKAIES